MIGSEENVAAAVHRYSRDAGDPGLRCGSTVTGGLKPAERSGHGVDLAVWRHDAKPAVVADVEVRPIVKEGGLETRKKRRGSRLSIIRARAAARKGADVSIRAHAPHAVVSGIGDVHVALRIDDQILRAAERGIDGRAAVAGESRSAVSCDGSHYTVGGDLANAMVAGIGNVHISCRIDGDALGPVEVGVRRRPTVAGKLKSAVAYDGIDLAARRGDHPDAVIAAVRDPEIPA